jgi:hypothetical protein
LVLLILVPLLSRKITKIKITTFSSLLFTLNTQAAQATTKRL